MSKIENKGEKFRLETFFQARKLAIEILEDCIRKFVTGMSEEEALELIHSSMNSYGMKKKWHPTKVRFGKNTLKSFKEVSDRGIFLREEDIFFIDIGPIYEEHEADIGRTFVRGNNQDYLKIQQACIEVFEETLKKYRETSMSGKKLYDFAQEQALKKGYELNQAMKGHRLGDFPHHLFYKGGLSEIDFRPIENIWVLEIHLRDPQHEIGAFHEDIITM